MARRADWDNDDFVNVCDASSVKVQQIFESKSLVLTNTNPVIEEPVVDKIKSSSPTSFNHLPIRYGSAADIPYDEGFDLKSILKSKPILPSNDLMTLLNGPNVQKHPSFNNNLNELLIHHARDREKLIQVARQAQEDFINAINLD